MSWVRIDDQAWDHPKHVAAGPMAFALWVWGLLYCSRHETDGFIVESGPSRSSIPKVDAHISKLIESGLWEKVDGGYRVHDYLSYNPSKDQRIQRRKASSDRLATWRKRKGYAHGNAIETPLREDFGGVCNTAPVPGPVPVPQVIKEHTSRATLVQSTKNLAFAGRVRVPGWLHPEFVAGIGKLGGDDPDAAVRQWYRDLNDAVEASGEAIPDPVKFLRDKFKSWAASFNDPYANCAKVVKCHACGERMFSTDKACLSCGSPRNFSRA